MSAAGNEASNSMPTHNIHVLRVSPGPGPPRTAQGGLTVQPEKKAGHRRDARDSRHESRDAAHEQRHPCAVDRGERELKNHV